MFDVSDLSDVAVVRATGVLDHAALQPCRAALDHGLHRSGTVLLDLGRTVGSPPLGVALVGAMHRYLRARGARMVLVAVPPALRSSLDRAGLLPLYDLAPNLAEALSRRPGPVRLRQGGAEEDDDRHAVRP